MVNDCSKNPKVECINTLGSYKCGKCPAGYVGDGFKCEKKKFCDSDPCLSTSTCVEHLSACMCPYGYTGDGLKEGTGCAQSYLSECLVPCLNGGTCRVS